jgi:hypothetical protein
MLPRAAIAHRTTNRLRMRINARRDDEAFFVVAGEKLGQAFARAVTQVNARTGSILISGTLPDIASLAVWARNEGLFALDTEHPKPQQLAMEVASPLRSADRAVRQWSGGRLDMPGALFAALLLHGVIELVRGNWKTPPWYTAFWYAFGLYSTALFDQNPRSDPSFSSNA